MPAYHEDFEEGPGGWFGYQDGPGQTQKMLEWSPGRLTSRSPWWIDYNHAPPGAGYFHMLFCLSTFGPQTEGTREVGGPNRFIDNKCPIDFTGARISARLNGELRSQGAQLCVLLQGVVDDVHQQFIEAIAIGRGIPIGKIKKIADGRVFTGRRAQELKLVDQMGNLEDSIEWMQKSLNLEKRPSIVQEREEKSILEFLLKNLASDSLIKSVVLPSIPALQYIWPFGLTEMSSF